MTSKPTPQVGDIWHRVDGSHVDDGSETYQGMELEWQRWRVTKLTPAGAWLQCVEWPYKKQRFALSSGARWASRTKAEALIGLIARKRRHIAIVEHQAEAARETLLLAQGELAKMDGVTSQAAPA